LATAYISIGSNVDAEVNIHAAIRALNRSYTGLVTSTVYKNSAEGFDGDDFLNLVVGLETEQSIPDFVHSLHQIEAAQGRVRDAVKFSSRALDMDLLLYANETFKSLSVTIPRDEITRYAFVLQPLFELIPEYIHPQLKLSIAELWAEFDKKGLKMTPFNMTF